jgi:hypothetical protein
MESVENGVLVNLVLRPELLKAEVRAVLDFSDNGHGPSGIGHGVSVARRM